MQQVLREPGRRVALRWLVDHTHFGTTAYVVWAMVDPCMLGLACAALVYGRFRYGDLA